MANLDFPGYRRHFVCAQCSMACFLSGYCGILFLTNPGPYQLRLYSAKRVVSAGFDDQNNTQATVLSYLHYRTDVHLRKPLYFGHSLRKHLFGLHGL